MSDQVISVIVPIYNVEKYLNRCIESIVNQTYKNLEIILVDDGSPDKCPEICDEWAKKDNRIKVIHKKNGGISTARNSGLDASTGAFIGFVDGDDIVDPQFYETLVNEAENNDADISACSFTHYSADYTKYEEQACYIKNQKNFTSKELLTEFFESCKGEWVSLCNKIIRSYLFSGLRFPEGRVFEDWTLAPMIYSRASKICFTPKKYYGYVIHEGSVVRTKNLKTYYDCVCADYDHYIFFKARGISCFNKKIQGFARSDFRKCIKVYSNFKESKVLLSGAYNKCMEIGGITDLEKMMFKFPYVFKILYKLKG